MVMELAKKYVLPQIVTIAVLIGGFILFTYVSQAKADKSIEFLIMDQVVISKEVVNLQDGLKQTQLDLERFKGDNKVINEKFDSIKTDLTTIKKQLWEIKVQKNEPTK